MKMRLLTVVAVLCCLSLTRAATRMHCGQGVLDKTTGDPRVAFKVKECDEGVTKCYIKTTISVRNGIKYPEEVWDCGRCPNNDYDGCFDLTGNEY
jgi:hypothetical protein